MARKPKKKKVTHHKVGRPTKYKKEYAGQAEKVCSVFGADDKNLAEFFKISERTINNWKEDYPGFLQSIKRGKEKFDTENVEAALLKRALGYTYVEAHKESYPVKTGRGKNKITIDRVTTKAVKKEIVPDVLAQIFWLCNRQPGRWKHKQQLEHSGTIDLGLKDVIENFLSKLNKRSSEKSGG